MLWPRREMGALCLKGMPSPSSAAAVSPPQARVRLKFRLLVVPAAHDKVLLLNVDWLGWRGWQWLFVLEGLPAVVLGVITWLLLTDRPRDAKWLTPDERDHLEGV